MLVTVLLGLAAPAWGMYSDEIGAPVEDVWKAATESFQPKEIRKANPAKKSLETRWSEDEVVRSRGVFKKVLSQRFKRRSRFKVAMKQIGIATEIRIQGVYQEKPSGTSPGVSWKNTQPELEDLSLERALFMKILNKLEEIKRKS